MSRHHLPRASIDVGQESEIPETLQAFCVRLMSRTGRPVATGLLARPPGPVTDSCPVITLTPQRGRIFRITHIDNIPWILANGLHCRNSPTFDPNYKDIGNPDLIQKRAGRIVTVAPGGTLSDYIPFYFTPYSPMLLNIKTGYNGLKITRRLTTAK